MKTISIKDIEGIRIGNAQNFTGGTGCTAPDWRSGGVDQRPVKVNS